MIQWENTMNKTQRRIKAIGFFPYYIWIINDKIWKLLNKIFRVHTEHKPNWMPYSLWTFLKEIYNYQVIVPYKNMTYDETMEDLEKHNLRKFKKYF